MTTPRIHPDVATHWEGGTAYVGLLPAGPLVAFTGSGALIWSLLQEGGEDPIVERTAAAAGMPVEAIRTDVTDFVSRCGDLGLLESSD